MDFYIVGGVIEMKWMLNEKFINCVFTFILLFYAIMPLIPKEFFLPFFFTVGAILLLFLLFIKTPFPVTYFIVWKPIIFSFFILFSISLILLFEAHISKEYEKVIIIIVLISTILATGFYIIRVMFIVMMQISSKKQMYKGMKLKVLYTGLIFVFLLLPDILFSFTIYDLILGLYNKEMEGLKVTYWDKFYFSFSQHFMMGPSEIGSSMTEILLTDRIGQFALSVHSVLNKAMELTGISLIASLLIKGFNGGTKNIPLERAE